jgi:hypothetical protein
VVIERTEVDKEENNEVNKDMVIEETMEKTKEDKEVD